MKKSFHSSKEVEKVADVFDAEAASVRLKKWFPELDKIQHERLMIYLTELNRFSKTVNLVSSSTLKSAESVHVADCVFASRLIQPLLIRGEPLFDFGSGNGCPGLIFGALFPEQRVILIDRDERKMEFCKHVIRTMGLSNVEIRIMGVEDLPAGSVKNVVARGFAPFPRALIACRKLVPKGGKFFHLKSDGWAAEVASLPSQVFSHWTPSLVGQYRLADSNADLFVVLTDKVAD